MIVRRRSSWGRVVGVSIVILVVVLLIGIGVQQRWFQGHPSVAGACPTGQTLQGNGASFVNTLTQVWVQQFYLATRDQVNYVDGGSGVGISDLTQRTVDFAATDAPLSSSEQTAMPSTVLTLPVTAGALAVVYNVPGVPSGLNLSGAVLSDIYLGKITKWNDPAIADNNTGITLPSSTILTVHRSDAAGTTFVLSDYLSQDSPTWATTVGKGIDISFPSAPDQVAIDGNSALLAYVQLTPDTIGYSDLSSVLDSSNPTTFAAMQNPSGAFILPTLNDTASAIADKSAATTFPSPSASWYNISMVNAPGKADYPIATFTYYLVFQATDAGFAPTLAKSQVIVEWLTWDVTTGQSFSSALHYVQILPALAALDEQGIASMTFDGASIPSCT